MRTLLVSLSLAACAWGDITGVQVSVTSTQASIQYTTSSTAPCSVEVHESDLSFPLVNDVDPAKFSGANLDSRVGSAQGGNTRTFVAGKRVAERGLDSILYSRALQAATHHIFLITCSDGSYSGRFKTLNIPFG